MKEFAPKKKLARMPLEGRLVYTLFLLLTGAGLVFTFYWSSKRGTLSPSGISAHFRGSETEMAFPKTFAELAETAHFHFFTMPVFFLIVAHLFFLTGVSSFQKIFWSTLMFAAVTAEIAVPFLLVYVSASFSYVFIASHFLLLLSFFWMAAVSLKEMWAD